MPRKNSESWFVEVFNIREPKLFPQRCFGLPRTSWLPQAFLEGGPLVILMKELHPLSVVFNRGQMSLDGKRLRIQLCERDS